MGERDQIEEEEEEEPRKNHTTKTKACIRVWLGKVRTSMDAS